MKEILLSDWHFMRVLRLVFGSIAAMQFYQSHDVLIGAFSLFFFYQAITNTGCGVNNCGVAPSANKNSMEDVTFEEVKAEQKQ